MPKTPDKAKCALYARVSTELQDETLQLPRLRQMASQHGLEVFKEYTDKASGKDDNRPAWKELMADAKNGEFGTIFCVKLDRIMRSLVNLSNTMDELERYHVRLIAGDIGEIDPDSPNSMFSMRIFGAMAEWEREMISVRTKDALAAKRAAGISIGRPATKLPLNYIAEDWSQGMTIAEISRKYSVPRATLYRRTDEINAMVKEMGLPQRK